MAQHIAPAAINTTSGPVVIPQYLPEIPNPRYMRWTGGDRIFTRLLAESSVEDYLSSTSGTVRRVR
jgi:hypothetical protein